MEGELSQEGAVLVPLEREELHGGHGEALRGPVDDRRVIQTVHDVRKRAAAAVARREAEQHGEARDARVLVPRVCDAAWQRHNVNEGAVRRLAAQRAQSEQELSPLERHAVRCESGGEGVAADGEKNQMWRLRSASGCKCNA